MLNTDLHIADLSKHMSRSDFIRNALSAIRESMPEDDLPPLRPPSTQRVTSAPVMGAPMALARVVSEAGIDGSSSSLSSFTYSKAWEVEAENALRDIYNAVRSERILLPTNSNRQSMISLSNSLDSRKPRSPSSGYKRASILGRPNMNSVYSDGRMSPTGSYATSINEAQPFASIGFASNLSHTVIREHEDELHPTVSNVSVSTAEDLNDDELALLGAPWAKEGLLEHKIYMESGKRAKKNEWKQMFTVVQQGDLHMFVFGAGSGSGFSGGSVGGGNWLVSRQSATRANVRTMPSRQARSTSPIPSRPPSHVGPTTGNTAFPSLHPAAK
jgi:PH/SEC7 domain-containing protein